ncbi:hypothetical protein [Micromonospora sp. NPDC048063]|uniref:hypothetical protein n=1 Tax=Micromonospora sp. NPDC048063 TaxID=3364256 RepID=UPI00371AD324
MPWSPVGITGIWCRWASSLAVDPMAGMEAVLGLRVATTAVTMTTRGMDLPVGTAVTTSTRGTTRSSSGASSG